ncbi:MAG: hypothetical protein P9M14_07400 [Candidatus Alcyoniella australis]|nr:hypothetical protein [Candidatus Alcyoniella australis]
MALALLAVVPAFFISHPSNATVFKYYIIVSVMIVLAASWLCERKGWKTCQKVVTVALLLMLATTFLYQYKGRLKDLALDHKVQSWNAFHYVLGTKYFDELGYFDLYNAVILADTELEKPIFTKRNVPKVRDMYTYGFISRSTALTRARAEGVRRRFSDERWQLFKEDIQAIQTQRSPRRWAGPLRDRGFNPSPAWLIIHRPLLNAVDIRNPTTLQLLCSVELLLYVLTILIAWWAFGLRATLVGALWICLYHGNDRLLVGNYFHYDWLVLTVAAVALYHKGHPIAAAPILAYAAMMRGFPGLLALHPALCWLRDVVRLKMPARRYTVFLTALGLSCILMIALGSTTARGPGAWMEWKQKIEIHSANHIKSANRVGIGRLSVFDYSKGRAYVSSKKRAELIQRNKTAYHAGAALLLALTALAMLRRDDHTGMLLGFAAIFAMLILSRYYVSVWALLFTLPALDRRRRGNLIVSLYMFLLPAIYYAQLIYKSDMRQWYTYYTFNVGMLVLFLGLILYFLLQDLTWLRTRNRQKKQ